MRTVTAQDHPRRRMPLTVLAGTGILLTALNLRHAVTSVGSLLVDLQAATGMSATAAGVLTALPPICFGAFGLASGRIGRRYGPELTVLCALALVFTGLVLRVLFDDPWVFILLTVPALAGMAAGNVLLPVIVKAWFPHRLGQMTSLYTLVVAGAGTAIPAAVSVPLAQASGSLRFGLGFWALPALVAAVPWLLLRRIHRRRRTAGEDEAVPPAGAGVGSITGSLQAWALTGFFGLQSLGAYVMMGWMPTIYRDAGVSAGRSGLLLSAVTLLSGLMALTLPALVSRRADQRALTSFMVASTGLGYTGLLVAPAAAPELWALLIGVGMGAFPLAILLIGLRARTIDGTSRLSSLAQGMGYLLAAGGTFAIGAIRDATGTWDASILTLIALLVPLFGCGRIAGRVGYVDADA